MSSFLSQSREQFYQANAIKYQGPSEKLCPSNLPKQTGKAADFSLRPKTTSRKPKEKLKYTPLDPEKPKRHIPSPIRFDKQLSRPSLKGREEEIVE